MTKERPEVLFVCVHNAGRSQMAAGLVKLGSEGRVHVRSAGSAPGGEVNPAVVEAMRELGVDLSGEFPKPPTDEVVRVSDVVITMGCGDACPIYPGKRYEDWELVLSFLLMFVIMAVATDTRAVGEAAAIAIGGTIALDALVGGPISGASLGALAYQPVRGE
jgi:arsenate reductase